MAPNDGRYLENLVNMELSSKVNENFLFRRLYDSYTARGQAYPAQPADWFCCYEGKPFHLEAKTLGHAKGRLSRGSFSQLPSMRAWAKVGVTGLLLVHCYGYDSELYLLDVTVTEPNLKSWVIPELSKPILITNLLQEIILKLCVN